MRLVRLMRTFLHGLGGPNLLTDICGCQGQA